MKSLKNGFGLVEIIIACAMATAALVGFSQVGILALRLLNREKVNLEATLLAQEGLEAVRSVRDESWTAVASLTDTQNPSLRYYPVVQNGKWVLTTTSPGLINDTYDRFVQFEKVSRDASDRIVASGGTDDVGTRKVTAHASSIAGDVVLTLFVTNFQAYLPSKTDAFAASYAGAATDGNLANFPSQNAGDGDPGQSFTLGSAVEVSRVSLLLRRATIAPSDIYAELRVNPTSAPLATSQIINGSTITSTSASRVDFRFPDPVSLVAGTYYIRLRSVPDATVAGSGSVGYIYWQYGFQSPSGPYAGGVARISIGRLSNPSDMGLQLDQDDFGFKVYALQ